MSDYWSSSISKGIFLSTTGGWYTTTGTEVHPKSCLCGYCISERIHREERARAKKLIGSTKKPGIALARESLLKPIQQLLEEGR